MSKQEEIFTGLFDASSKTFWSFVTYCGVAVGVLMALGVIWEVQRIFIGRKTVQPGNQNIITNKGNTCHHEKSNMRAFLVCYCFDYLMWEPEPASYTLLIRPNNLKQLYPLYCFQHYIQTYYVCCRFAHY